MLSHRGRAGCRFTQGEMTAVAEYIEAVRRLVSRRDTQRARALLASLEGMRALLEGRFEEAEKLNRQTLGWVLRNSEPVSLARCGAQLAVLLLQQGRLEELGGVLEHMYARFPKFPLARCARAHFECAAGRPERARRHLEMLAGSGFSALPRDGNWLMGLALLSEVCRTLGDEDHGAKLYELLRPYRALGASLGGSAFYGSVSHHLGGLATLLEETGSAAAHYGEALAMHGRMGALPWLAYTQHDFARMLLARGEALDRSRALELAGDSLATARELGMAPLAERAEALQQEIQGAIPLRTRRRPSPR